MRELFEVGPHAGAHRVAARAGISVFVPLLVLVLSGHTGWTTFAAFGAFTSLYGRSHAHGPRAGLQLSAGLVLSTSVALGCAVGLLPDRHWWVVLFGALLTGAASLISDAFGWHPPGPLFPLFAFTVCSMIPPQASNIPLGFLIAAISAGFSMVIGHVGILRTRGQGPRLELPSARFGEVWHSTGTRRHLVRFIVAVAIAGALGTLMGGSHPYWAMVAAVAGLSGPTVWARVRRGLHRLLGTLAGVGVAALVLPLHPRGVAAVLVIVAFQVGAELLIGRNYGLALLCITPLALMMGQLGHEVPVGPLLGDRVVETLIGCLVALAVLALVRDPAREDPGPVPVEAD